MAQPKTTRRSSRLGLESRLLYLEQELEALRPHGALVGPSSAMSRIRDQIHLAADSDVWTLIQGPPGSGKSLAAWTIHKSKPDGQLIELNCGGNVPGEETVRRLREAWRLGANATILLRAVDRLPADGQDEILRLIARSNASRRKRPHVVSTTSADPAKWSRTRKFSKEFHDRITLISIEIPPLHERPEDILPIAEHFMRKASVAARRTLPSMTDTDRRRLMTHSWPGNVRELRMAVELAVLRTPVGVAKAAHDSVTALKPPATTGRGPATLAELEQCERQILERALDESKGRVYGNLGAAARLGVPATTLTYRLNRLGIRVPRSRSTRWDSTRLRR